MHPKIVISLYKPHAGKEQELEDRILHHVEALIELGMVSYRPRLVFKSKNGTYIELLERTATQDEDSFRSLRRFKESMADVCEIKTLADLPEAHRHFADFEEVLFLSETYSPKGAVPIQHVKF